MKNATLLIYSLLFVVTAYGQSSEMSLKLNSGLFSFSGASAQSSSFFNYNMSSQDGHTNNPYGSKGGLSIGFSTDLTRVSQNNFLVGLDLGYELLRSRTRIKEIITYDQVVTTSVNADGRTNLNLSFLNLFPKMGYRWILSDINIDLVGGMDLAYCFNAHEHGKATADGRTFSTQRERKTIALDMRPRVQVHVKQGNYGVYVGYSRGLIDYRADYVGGTNRANGNIFRFGMSYLLKRN